MEQVSEESQGMELNSENVDMVSGSSRWWAAGWRDNLLHLHLVPWCAAIHCYCLI